jgi:hypothetical protein
MRRIEIIQETIANILNEQLLNEVDVMGALRTRGIKGAVGAIKQNVSKRGLMGGLGLKSASQIFQDASRKAEYRAGEEPDPNPLDSPPTPSARNAGLRAMDRLGTLQATYQGDSHVTPNLRTHLTQAPNLLGRKVPLNPRTGSETDFRGSPVMGTEKLMLDRSGKQRGGGFVG